MRRRRIKVSNEILMGLLLVAIVVSIISTFTSFFGVPLITGKVTDTGQLSVNITPVIAVNISGSVDWGSGETLVGSSCTLDTEGTMTCSGFNTVSSGFTVTNNGNQNVSVWVKTGLDAAGLIGGTSPAYQYKITNTTASCNQTFSSTTWTDVNTAGSGDEVCPNFFAEDDKDDFNIQIRLVLPSDAVPGEKTDTITVTAQAV